MRARSNLSNNSRLRLGRPRRLAPEPDGLGGGGALSLLDNFTDTNSVSLDAHAIAPTNSPRTAWVERAGDWQITSNRAVMVGANDTIHIASVNLGQSDVDITVVGRLLVVDDLTMAVLLRFVDTSNYWFAGINPSLDEISITKREGGSNTKVANTAVTIDTGIDYTLRVRAVGSTITAWVDGGSQVQYTSATFQQTATLHGIRSFKTGSNPGANFDSFQALNP